MKISKDWLIRTLKTFVQVAGGVIATEVTTLLSGDLGRIKGVLIAAFSAGICAIWNIIRERLEE